MPFITDEATTSRPDNKPILREEMLPGLLPRPPEGPVAAGAAPCGPAGAATTCVAAVRDESICLTQGGDYGDDDHDHDELVRKWLSDRYGVDYIGAVSIDAGDDGSMQVTAHVSRAKRFRQRWKTICSETRGHPELKSLLKCDSFELFVVADR